MSVKFEIVGPIDLPFKVNDKRAKMITRADGIDCLKEHDLEDSRGCYVFCVRGSHGAISPYYVGKASKTFGQECFAADKINKYNIILHRKTHGRPIMIIVRARPSKGKFNATALRALELYLIELAYVANDDIQNVHGIPKPLFEIAGVHSHKAGPTSGVLKVFLKAFKI